LVFEAIAGQQADEIGALMLLEHDRLHIGQVDDHVDDGELQVREFGRDLLQRGRLAEADGDDRRIAVAGEAAQRLLDLGVVGRLEIAELDAGLRLNFSAPMKAPSLKDLSNLPPLS
jgi:hypothetical protein